MIFPHTDNISRYVIEHESSLKYDSIGVPILK